MSSQCATPQNTKQQQEAQLRHERAPSTAGKASVKATAPTSAL